MRQLIVLACVSWGLVLSAEPLLPPQGEQILDRIREQNPEEFIRLKALRHRSPEAFRKEMRKRGHRLLRSHREGHRDWRELLDLARQAREAGSAEEQKRLQAHLQSKVEAGFDAEMGRAEARLDELQARLAAKRAELARRRVKRDAECKRRIQALMNGAESLKR